MHCPLQLILVGAVTLDLGTSPTSEFHAQDTPEAIHTATPLLALGRMRNEPTEKDECLTETMYLMGEIFG